MGDVVTGESDELRQLRALVDSQQLVIDTMTQQLQTKSAPHEAAPSKGSLSNPTDTPIDWTTVSGAERVAAWQGLFQFVLDIVDRYGLYFDVRPCWWLHADAVEELAALWHIRQWCYRPDAGLDKAAVWLDNLHKSRDRLRSIFPSCRQKHVEAGRPGWMTAEMSHAFHEYVQRDPEATRSKVSRLSMGG
jgi:hypothetical protein